MNLNINEILDCVEGSVCRKVIKCFSYIAKVMRCVRCDVYCIMLLSVVLCCVMTCVIVVSHCHHCTDIYLNIRNILLFEK